MLKKPDLLQSVQLVIAIVTVLSIGFGGLRFLLATEFIEKAEAANFATKLDIQQRLDSIEEKLDKVDIRMDRLLENTRRR